MRTILIIYMLLSLATVIAQKGSISGVILDVSDLPVSGVSVFLEGTTQGDITDSDGSYKLDQLAAGHHVLYVSSLGYQTEKRTFELRAEEDKVIDIVLKESVSTLSEIVVITKGIAGLRDIPGSVSYISPREIEKFSYTDVNRSLSMVPGVNVQEEDGFGLRPNIGLRGTGVERSSKITVMEDGVLMAPAPYVAPAAYYFPTIGRMQGIEILKGSSQIKYGPYTTGGAINLLSTAIPEEFSGRIHLFSGSFGMKNLHSYVGDQGTHFGFLVESYQYGADGFKKLDGGGETGFDKKDYLVKLRWRTSDDAKFGQSIELKWGLSTERAAETYLGLTQEDFETDPYRRYAASQKDEIRARQTQLSLTHRAQIAEQVEWSTVAYRTTFSRNWYKLDKLTESGSDPVPISTLLDYPEQYPGAYNALIGIAHPADVLYLKANNRSYFATGVETRLGMQFSTEAIEHELDIGLRLHRDQIDRFQWIDEYSMENGDMKLAKAGIPGTESNRVETVDALAGFVQYRLKLAKFSVIPGLRYEHIQIIRSDYGKSDIHREGLDRRQRTNVVGVIIPGIGLDYKFDRYTGLFGGVHKGFAPPGSKEGTEPEQSINYEFGLRHTRGTFSTQAVLFLNDYDNLLGSDLSAAGGLGTADLFNGGKVLTKGLELELSYVLQIDNTKKDIRLPFTLAYSYTDSEFRNDFDSDFGAWGKVSAGDEFPYLAPHQLSLRLGLELDRFAVYLHAKYQDQMRTLPGQVEILESQSIDAYTIIDASMRYRLGQQVSLFASANNLTRSVYAVARRPAGLRPGMPRSFLLGAKADF